MTATILPKYSNNAIRLTPGQGIAIFTIGQVKVNKRQGFPNHPNSFQNIGYVKNQLANFGPFPGETLLELSTDGIEALYEVGLSPIVKQTAYFAQIIQQPDIYSENGIILASSICKSAVVMDAPGAGSFNLSLPSAIDINLASQFDIGELYQIRFINLSVSAEFTIVGDQLNSNLVGNGVIPANSSAMFVMSKVDSEQFFTARVT